MEITVAGRKVTVDDSFRSLSPEEQDATVDEIYSAMGMGEPEATANPVASTLPGPLAGFQDFSRAFQSGANQGMTLGFGDELQAGLFAIPEAIGGAVQGNGFDLGQGYNTALERVRGIDEASAALNPIANLAGNVTGNAVLAGSVPNFSRQAAPTIGSMAGRGALDGLIYGSIAGFGTGEELSDRAQQAATGGIIGGALGGVAGGVAGALANKSVAAATPEAEELFDQAGALYDAARDSKVVFPQQSVKTTADDIAAKVISEGLDPDLHPRATAALRRLQEASGKNMTAQDAMTLRRVIGAAAGDLNNPDQTRIASIMRQSFDDFIAQSIPETVAANALYQTANKTQLIENTIQRARDAAGPNFSGSGFENALRQQFKGLLFNKSALRGFSDAEVAAIRKVANGGPIENVLRYIGKAAPTGVVSGGLAGGAGYAIGGLPGAAAVLGTGTAARMGATASTLNNANLARALVASGGQLQGLPAAATAFSPSASVAGAVGGNQANNLVARALFGQ
jgi:hypothetical protein